MGRRSACMPALLVPLCLVLACAGRMGRAEEIAARLVGGSVEDIAVNTALHCVYTVNQSRNDRTLSIWDSATGAFLSSTSLGEIDLRALAVNEATGRVFALGSPDKLLVLDAASGALLTTVHLPVDVSFQGLARFTVDSEANRIYVAIVGMSGLVVLDGMTYARLPDLAAPYPVAASDVAVSPHLGRVYLLDWAGKRVVVFDAGSGAFRTTLPIALDETPWRLAVDAKTDRLYVMNGYGSMEIFDGATETRIGVVDPPARSGATDLAVDASTGRVYVAHYQTNRISILTGERWEEPVQLTRSISPMQVAVDPGTHRVFAASRDGAVSILDTETKALSFLPSLHAPSRVAVNPATGRVYTASAYVLTALHPGTRTPERAVLLPADGGPWLLAADPAMDRLYAAGPAADGISVMDGTTLAMLGTITTPLSERPSALAVDASANRVYTAHYHEATGAANLCVADSASRTAIGTFPLLDGAEPRALAVSPGANRIYVANAGLSSITVLDRATYGNLATVALPAGTHPVGLAAHPQTGRLYIRNGNATGGPGLLVMDEVTYAITPIQRIPVGAGGADAVALNPETGRAYVVDGSLYVVDTAWDALQTVVDAGTSDVAVDSASGRVYTVDPTAVALTIVQGPATPQAFCTVADGARALRIAAGLVEGDAFDVACFDVSAPGPTARVHLDDAARLLRRATGLDVPPS